MPNRGTSMKLKQYIVQKNVNKPLWNKIEIQAKFYEIDLWNMI